jgi:PAS domain S-box-containing protein
MLHPSRSAILGYGVAVVAVVLAALARAAVDPLVGQRVPFATFYVAIVAVGFFGSLGAALLATILSAFLGNYLFVEPRFALPLINVGDIVALSLFVITGGIVAVLADAIHKTRRRLNEAAHSEARHTEEVQAERQRLQDIIQSIPGVVWEAWGQPDSDSQRIDYVSDYVKTMVGYTPGEWTSRPNFWLQLVAPEDRERAARAASERFASGEPGENEFRWITKDGRSIWALTRSSTIKNENGTPVGMRGVTFDITDRKETERRLGLLSEISTTGLSTPTFNEVATHIARRVADVVGDYCVIRMMRDGALETVAYAHVVAEAEPMVRAMAATSNVDALNPIYAETLKQPRTVIDNDLSEGSFDHVNRAGVEDLFKRYQARRGLVTPLLSHGELAGTLAFGRASGSPYTAADGRLAEAIAARASLALDNARLFEAAQRDADEARKARADAEEAGRVKDEFLATLSHELRTPLNAILGWAHMLQDPRLPPERRQAAVETIVRNAQSQEQLISDILDVQRIMAGKIRLNMRNVDMGNIIRSAAETVQPSADAKRVRLQLLLDLDAPPIFGDPDRLQQVVWNLLSNAIKFAPPGGHVHVRLLKHDTTCELVIEDNGPGINPDFIPFMFERFRQADSSTTRTHKGLGLGLAIVRSLVEMHGGTIVATNKTAPDATGAVFTIRLPRNIAQTASDGEGTAEHEAQWLGEAPSLAGVGVLVVEDDSDARDLVEAILLRCGADVTVASSAADGFAEFQKHRPDVLVSDIEMPEEDGYSFIRRIRALPPGEGGGVPAAALTAYASPSDRMKVLGAGFNIHVAKPVQPVELAVVIASLADRRT